MLSDTAAAAWHGLLRCQSEVVAEMDRRLKADHNLSVSGFDVLITLANAEDDRLRMNELADRILLSGAGLTHLVSRLEGDGLVIRRRHAGDGRGVEAVLTAAGRRRLAAARPTHDAVIHERLIASLTQRDVAALARIWEKRAARAGA